jgi:hypothetical protein
MSTASILARTIPLMIAFLAASCSEDRKITPDLKRASNLYGAALLNRVDQLPYMDRGVRTLQESSHDRTGGNMDGFSGEYSYLYREGDSYVIFDADGPGCVNRIWFTGLFPINEVSVYAPIGNINFYLDGNPEPAQGIDIKTFFKGGNNPFLFPLAGWDNVSSGGCYSYVPICFKEHLKISTDGMPMFHQVTYSLMSRDYEVESYKPGDGAMRAWRQWLRTGYDPKGWEGNLERRYFVKQVGKQAIQVGEIAGPGAVAAIRMRVPPDEATLDGLWLKIYWDGEQEPSVLSPVGEFFGSGLEGADFRSLFFGMRRNGEMYNYFPMPFGKSMRIELENRTDSDIGSVAVTVEYNKAAYDDDALRFKAQFREGNPTTPGARHTILETGGAGKLVGNTHTFRPLANGLTQCKDAMNDKTGLCYLEGDDMVWTDGKSAPDILGTGTEDMFNGGWYFNKDEFALPLHGVPVIHKDVPGRLSAYRTRIGDASNYSRGITYQIETGPLDNVAAHYRTTAFYYGRPEDAMVLSDELEVGDAASESAHAYEISGASQPSTCACLYEGPVNSFGLTDSGRVIDGRVKFTAKIDPDNYGVRLRVRVDQGYGRLAASVYFDGQFAGRFYHAYVNEYRRWTDLELDIPAYLARGKSSGTIEVERAPDAGWNEYRYEVYSIR